jgi:hypothetical protein
MEEWFYDCNEKDEVNNERPLIVNVLKILQELFLREEETNGYCIPKMHGMTKFQSCIKRYEHGVLYLKKKSLSPPPTHLDAPSWYHL